MSSSSVTYVPYSSNTTTTTINENVDGETTTIADATTAHTTTAHAHAHVHADATVSSCQYNSNNSNNSNDTQQLLSRKRAAAKRLAPLLFSSSTNSTNHHHHANHIVTTTTTSAESLDSTTSQLTPSPSSSSSSSQEPISSVSGNDVDHDHESKRKRLDVLNANPTNSGGGGGGCVFSGVVDAQSSSSPFGGSSDRDDPLKVYGSGSWSALNNTVVCGYQLVGASKEFTAYHIEKKIVKTCQIISLQQYQKVVNVRKRLNEAAKYWKYDDLDEMREFVLPSETEIYEDHLGRLFLFSPWRYGSLQQKVQSAHCTPLSELDIQPIFKQIVRVIAFCHTIGIVLRDLKLRKFVFIDKQLTQLRLHDVFDLFVCEDVNDDGVRDRHSCPAYVAPEILIKGPTQYAGRPADIWALGVLLYVLLFGRYPFNDTTPQRLFSRILKARFCMPVGSNVSCAARALIYGMLRKDPAERPAAVRLMYMPWISTSSEKLLRQIKFSMNSTSTPNNGSMPPQASSIAAAAATAAAAELLPSSLEGASSSSSSRLQVISESLSTTPSPSTSSSSSYSSTGAAAAAAPHILSSFRRTRQWEDADDHVVPDVAVPNALVDCSNEQKVEVEEQNLVVLRDALNATAVEQSEQLIQEAWRTLLAAEGLFAATGATTQLLWSSSSRL